MPILLLGARGYLGRQFLTAYPEAHTPSVDIADHKALEDAFEGYKPNIVINCAGKTGRPNVDWCEEHKLETIRSNVTGPLLLLDECLRRNVYLVHLSSGCIYSGDNGGRGFGEDDPPNFWGSFYARSKAWIDRMFHDFPVLNLRLRMPFDGSQSDRNLIVKLRKYARVLDMKNSLTYLPDFLRAAKELIHRRATGTFNVVNEGTISPYRIMELYKEMVDPAHSFERLTLDHLPEVVKAGRSNCTLNTQKLRSSGIAMRPVEDAVREALRLMAG